MKIGIIDLVGQRAPRNRYLRAMQANSASVMAQVVGVWCEEDGHAVSIAYYSGPALLAGGLPDDVEMVFFSAFSRAALSAYALSARLRARGVITVLGGPHARSYPEDARRHFDYVVGLCDRATLREILHDRARYPDGGLWLSAARQPPALPALRRRWKFLAPAMEVASLLRLVPLLGSLGCPYTCSFCIDGQVPYQPLDYATLVDDLRFVTELGLPRTLAAWHDPNFGVRFGDYMDVVEQAVPRGTLKSIAEMSLSLLPEKNLVRLRRNGFVGLAPGIESWFELGDKSGARALRGEERVRRLAEHANLVRQYVPYLQCNLIFGLDADEGDEPFELTRRFVDLAPGVYPFFSMRSAFGRNVPENLELQRQGRVIAAPFHFLDLVGMPNVRPRHYAWDEFYERVCATYGHAFSARAMARRFAAGSSLSLSLEQLVRGLLSDRPGRLGHHRRMRAWLREAPTREFFEGRTRELPSRFVAQIRADLGALWESLPPDALTYDPNAYLNAAQ